MPKDNKDFFKTKNRWSEIKDQLLGSYLTPYFQKVLKTGQPIFYVDCFAGKGKFEDGNPGSPIIALQARDGCLSRTKVQSGKIDTCFIDLNYAQELRANIAGFNNRYGNPNVVSGKYEDKIEGLLSNKRGINVFLYIEPYGIKALDSALFDKFETLGLGTLEMLINFNTFGFFRDAGRMMSVDYQSDEAVRDLDDLIEYEPTPVNASKQSEELLSSIAGGEYWKAIVVDYQAGKINGYQAERRLSTEYKQRLRQRYGYVLDMPIRLKAGQRPKYRMIHVCDHEDGCFLMAQNMQKRKDELFINVQQDGQLTLFDIDPTVSSTVENELMTVDQIKVKLKEHLSRFIGDVGLTKLLATFANDYGMLCDFKMIYSMLEELKVSCDIDIVRNPAFTEKGKPSAFWEESKDKKIIIRRRKP
jgi:three-Cys-motif partner protein